MIEHLVRQGTNWGRVIAMRSGSVLIRWNRVGLLSRTRKTWERREDVEFVLPE